LVVGAPVEEVFGYLTNVDNYTELVSSSEEVRDRSGSAVGWRYQAVCFQIHGTGDHL